ncbi:hypothetical protein Tco_1155563 [Tanacetum coccineum]
MESLDSNSQERELHQMQLEERQMHSNSMACFKGLEPHLRSLYQNSLAFRRFFGEEHQTFKLQSKDVQINLVQAVNANLVVTESSRIELENNSSENALNKSVNETQMQMQEGKVDMGKALDAGLVVIESSRTKSDKQDTSNRLGNYTTHAVDADIRPVNDQEPFAEVQLTAQHNVLANEQQHTEQSEPIYDTYLLEKVDSNITHDSTNMSNIGGEIDQNAEKCQVTSPLLDPLT